MSEHVSAVRMHEAIDGELTAAERGAMGVHLDRCATCREEYARLSEVTAAVRSLPRSARPPEEAWDGILERIGGISRDGGAGGATVLELPTGRASGASGEADEGGGERATSVERVGGVRLSVPQLAAAAAAVALLSAGAMRIAMGGPTPVPTGTPPVAEEVRGAAARAVSLEEARYGEMVAELELVLTEGRALLAPETLATIDEALGTVDAAIAEIEAALAEDPNSDLLRRLLTSHRNTKLGVLQRAAGAVQSQI